MARTWDIFCSVVDNYGDVSVCWRLARQLAVELKQTVRLWVDDLAAFHRMCHAIDPKQASQRMGEVEVRHWSASFPRAAPADIVIEGFGVRLPAVYVGAMAARSPRPAWINLEYLSAESWVEGCHKLPSPHPSLPLTKHFFFPGFTPATGGLLMESGLAREREAFQVDPAANAAFWRSLGVAEPDAGALRMSLFCYDNAALRALVEAWRAGPPPAVCIVPDSPVVAPLSDIVGRSLEVGSRVNLGCLTIQVIPFLELDQYDRLLWACDLNFVRGEDSFSRSQLAARPMVWQAYRQADGAHMRKVAAFLERYAQALDSNARSGFCVFTEAWNREAPDVGRLWTALAFHRNALSAHSRNWAGQLAAGGNLVIELAKFCEDQLK